MIINKNIEKTNVLLVFIRKCSALYYGIRHKLEDTFKQKTPWLLQKEEVCHVNPSLEKPRNCRLGKELNRR